MAAPEATIPNYGMYNPAPAIAYTIVDACTHAGYLMHVTSTAGSLDCTDALTDFPCGFIVKSTVPPTQQAMSTGYADGTALAGQFIGVQALIPGQEVYLMLGATIAVPCGSYCGPSSEDGMLSPRIAAGSIGSAAVICCVTMEAKGPTATAATVGSAVKVKVLNPMYLAVNEVPT
jgi:hypothetical protein